MKTFSELAECLARIPPKITLYGPLFKYSNVGRLLLLMFSTDLLFAIKRDAHIFMETGWFCRFPKEKSGKHVGPNFTLNPNKKASSLQFGKTTTSAITPNRSSRERVKDSFTRLIHSCQCHFIHIYVCLYLQLPLDDINSIAFEWIVRGTLAELSKNLLMSLSLRNKIILSKLEAVVCKSYGLLFAWSPFGHYLGEHLVKKWYKAHILLG